MNKKRLMGFVCALLCVCFAGVCAYAENIDMDDSKMTVDSKKLDKNVKEKLTAELIEVLLTDPDTSIPVCVWLKDIDEEAVLKTMPLSLSQGVQAQTSDDEFHLQSYLVEKRSYYTNAYECHNYGIIDSLLNIGKRSIKQCLPLNWNP